MSTLKKIYSSKIVKVAIQIVFSFIIAFSLLTSLRIALGVDNPLYVVSSGSMIPTLNIGDIIVVQRIMPTQVNIGDIVVFRNPHDLFGAPIVHRVVDIKVNNGNIKVFTKGDATGVSFDQFSPWDASLLIGKVIIRIPYIGNIYLSLAGADLLARDRLIVLIFILILIILMVLLFFPNSEDKKKRELEKSKWSYVRLIRIAIINVLIIYFMVFSLWGHIRVWQPSAFPYQQVDIMGMFKELQINAEKFSGENVSLMIGFMTYRIDCIARDKVRHGVLTFSWFQFLLLILILFDVTEILVPFIRHYLGKKSIKK